MTATGSHEYFYSLRGAQPPGEGFFRLAGTDLHTERCPEGEIPFGASCREKVRQRGEWPSADGEKLAVLALLQQHEWGEAMEVPSMLS